MKSENLKLPEDSKKKKIVFFPINDVETPGYFQQQPELKNGIISRYFTEGKTAHLRLLQKIDDLNYILYVDQYSGEHSYSFGFKTQEYEYALVNQNEESLSKIIKTVEGFLESIYSQDPEINYIIVEPASQSYTRQEIDDCINKILESSNNIRSEEELRRDFKGFRIFDLYEQLFKKDFHKKHYNLTSRAKDRSRLFKMITEMYLQNWEIDKNQSLSTLFVLRRKESK
ncbi:MAG: hypothetical protein HY225_01740 [Candidatus Vogelbacteria bacterium]|nr:hypothetical protein [Candidatus Vogelbacteria bacterium]